MRAGGLGEVTAVGPSVKSLKVGDKVEGIVGGSLSIRPQQTFDN